MKLIKKFYLKHKIGNRKRLLQFRSRTLVKVRSSPSLLPFPSIVTTRRLVELFVRGEIIINIKIVCGLAKRYAAAKKERSSTTSGLEMLLESPFERLSLFAAVAISHRVNSYTPRELTLYNWQLLLVRTIEFTRQEALHARKSLPVKIDIGVLWIRDGSFPRALRKLLRQIAYHRCFTRNKTTKLIINGLTLDARGKKLADRGSEAPYQTVPVRSIL